MSVHIQRVAVLDYQAKASLLDLGSSGGGQGCSGGGRWVGSLVRYEQRLRSGSGSAM